MVTHNFEPSSRMLSILLDGLVTETIMPDQSTHEYDQMLEYYLSSMTNTTF